MSEEPFGRYLLERGAVSRRALEQATQAKVLFGGRLGAHLVESGALGLDELERHLSGHLQVPLPPPAELERPAREALGAVPREIIERLEVVPFRLEPGTLCVGMADPWNPDTVNELARASGLRIQPYLVAETRLFLLLEKHFGIRRDTRAIELLPEPPAAARAPSCGSYSYSPQRPPQSSEGRGVSETLGLRPLRPGEELVDAETFAALHERFGNRASPKTVGPVEIDLVCEVEDPPARATDPDATPDERLLHAGDVEEVGRATLAAAGQHAPLASLFVVRPGERIECLGSLTRDAEFRGTRPFCAVDALLAQAVQTGEIRRALLVHQAGATARDVPGPDVTGEALVFPIVIQGRLVNLLYVESPTPLGGSAESDLAALCDRVAAAYQRIILARKQRFC